MTRLKKVVATVGSSAILLSLLTGSALAYGDGAEANPESATQVHVEVRETISPDAGLLSWFFTKRFYVGLTGDQEVPGPGDEDAFGSATIRLYPNQSKVCINIHVWNSDQPTGAHIHRGLKGEAGPVVVILPTPDADGRANACVEVDSEKIQDIRTNASNYYVNIHTAKYPDGALRGQLTQ